MVNTIKFNESKIMKFNESENPRTIEEFHDLI